MKTEITNGNWYKYCESVVPFTYKDNTYLLAQGNSIDISFSTDNFLLPQEDINKSVDNGWFVAELTPDMSALKTSLPNGHWANYYGTVVPFISGGNTYLFAQTNTNDNRWFISELTAEITALKTELANGKWDSYYGTAVPFTVKGIGNSPDKTYLFAQTDTRDNRWFISELKADDSTMNTELAHGNWDSYYGTAIPFTIGGKNYLFAQTDTRDNRWFISELKADVSTMNTELAHGNWDSYYGTAVPFTIKDKNKGDKTYIFAQTDTRDNRWFISELTPNEDGLKTELVHGNWANYYGTAIPFTVGDKTYLYAQTETSNGRWFITELTPDGANMYTELAFGYWINYHGSVVPFVIDNTIYLFAQSEANNNHWFICKVIIL